MHAKFYLELLIESKSSGLSNTLVNSSTHQPSCQARMSLCPSSKVSQFNVPNNDPKVMNKLEQLWPHAVVNPSCRCCMLSRLLACVLKVVNGLIKRVLHGCASGSKSAQFPCHQYAQF
eukprot:4161088-Amphidinium_carterae.2